MEKPQRSTNGISASPLDELITSLSSQYEQLKKADADLQTQRLQWLSSTDRWMQTQAKLCGAPASDLSYRGESSHITESPTPPRADKPVSVLIKDMPAAGAAPLSPEMIIPAFRQDDRTVNSPVAKEPPGDESPIEKDPSISASEVSDRSKNPKNGQKMLCVGDVVEEIGPAAATVTIKEKISKGDSGSEVHLAHHRNSNFDSPFKKRVTQAPARPGRRVGKVMFDSSGIGGELSSTDLALLLEAREKGDQHATDPEGSGGYENPWMSCRLNLRLLLLRLFLSPYFEFFIASVIMANAVLVGVEVEYGVHNPHKNDLPTGLFISGIFFNIIFCLEVMIRIIVMRMRFFSGPLRYWNTFDSFLVLLALVEMGVDAWASNGALGVLKLVRMTRILRVLRVARIVRLLVALRLLFVQILGTLRTVFWAMVLLLIILYAFGMIFAHVTSEHIRDYDGFIPRSLGHYWGSVPRSMYTLYMSISGGVDWQEAVKPLSTIHWVWVVVFNFFLAFTIFAVLNVVVGVFCQNAIQTAAHDYDNAVHQKIQEKRTFTNKMRLLFLDLDESEDGNISYQELKSKLDDEKVVAYFEALGLDTSDAWDLFQLLDADSSANVECEEFVNGCLRLRGPAKAIDTAKLAYEMDSRHTQLQDSLSGLMHEVLTIKRQVTEQSSSRPPSVSKAPKLTVTAM